MTPKSTAEPQVRKNKHTERREASYEALVDSAMRTFHEHGYARTTVAAIVEGTGYSPGAFYFHFDNKADCLWHVIAYRERQRADWAQLVAQADDRSATLEELVADVFAHFAASLDGVNAWVLVMVDFAQQHRDDPVVRARLAETYRHWRQELVRFVEALQERGKVDSDRDPLLVATQLFAFAEGVSTHAAVYSADPALIGPALLDGTVRILRD